MRVLLLPLLAALLAACAAEPPRTVSPQWPPLDSALATPCTLPDAPEAALNDYDARDDYWQHQALPALADCAQRKARIVEAWERARQ
jgi:hypothetical protein